MIAGDPKERKPEYRRVETLIAIKGSGIIACCGRPRKNRDRRMFALWGVAKWQGTGFWSRDRRFESCRPSPWFPRQSPWASRT